MKSERGLTLIEMVITMVIISIALVASLKSFSVLSGRSSDVMIQTRALDLAQLYIDEILSHRFDEASGIYGVPTYTGICRITDDGETRENYDDVDDFDAISAESPALIDSALVAAYTGFSVSVSVTCDDSIGVNDEGGKLIQVTINDPLGHRSIFSVYKGNY
ncbi:prepilin-type N-terminal cleavage/methylation domain-containing protein [Thalassolituus oleivorans]|jgi:MSHA pilin protein MshD|uniref:prepilin-type N-terminal cleavage/methylation domain-containing protein n=1 Tax=Thalassolituus oleivorans TaxID=187493 RepID=UPI0023F57409|nr:prepilin-type N-terminal cleavage/methylation domain-containing protein [Thalassolituus oleivorans]MDF1642291.1 prepilin-type N-terminal cleavage/methylation domain-containing protein [Thalassolituus oleivorans]